MKHLIVVVAAVVLAAPAFAQTEGDSWSKTDYLPMNGFRCGIVETGDPDVVIITIPPYLFMKYTISTGRYQDLNRLSITRLMAHMPSTNQLFVVESGNGIRRYAIATNEWKNVTGLSQDVDGAGNNPVAIVATNTKVYALGVSSNSTDTVRNRFFELNPALASPANSAMVGNWVQKAAAPADIYSGASLAWDGGDFIYAVFGGEKIPVRQADGSYLYPDTASPKFHRYSISTNTWSAPLADSPEASTGGNALAIDRANGILYHRVSKISRYSIATGTWSMDAAALAGQDGGMVCTGAGSTLLFPGNLKMNHYSVAAAALVAQPVETIDTPEPMVAITSTLDGESLYLLSEGFDASFRRYSTVTGEWSGLKPVSKGYKFSFLVHTGGDFIYAIRDYSGHVARYSITSNDWKHNGETPAGLPVLPDSTSIGAACRGPGGSLYVLDSVANGRPSNTNGILYRLEDSAGGWMPMTLPPANIVFSNLGANVMAMTWDGVDRLYCVGYMNAFVSYSISENAWSTVNPTPCPAAFGSNVSLYYPGARNKIYAFSGNPGSNGNVSDGSRRFWAYTTTNDTWTELAMAPFCNGGESAGGWASNGGYNTLAYPGGTGDLLYCVPAQGTGQANGIPVMTRYRMMPNGAPTVAGALTQVTVSGLSVGSDPINLRNDLLLGCSPADPDLDPVALEVEVKAVTASFDDVSAQPGIRSGLLPSGGAAEVRIPAASLAFGQGYKWRVRSIDDRGAMSGWTESASPAFAIIDQNGPEIGLAGQYDQGGQLVADGGGIYDVAILCVSGNDIEGDAYRLLVEVRAAVGDFQDEATGSSSLVANGATAEVRVAGLAQRTFVWQYCLQDEYGFRSAWTRYGTGSSDFYIEALGSVASGGGCPVASARIHPGLNGAILGMLVLLLRRRESA